VAPDPLDPSFAPWPAQNVTPESAGEGPTTVLDDLPPSMSHAREVPPERAGPPRGGKRWVLEWVVVGLVAVTLAFGMRVFVVGTYFIPSGSMEPTLMVNDRILVNKLSYDFHPVHRGDIVVFGRPADEPADDQIKDLVKRVIGLPGETISSSPSGQVLINGKPLAEPWLPASARANPGGPINRQTIPPGNYFVMGDNRDNSSDSRAFGTIPESIIVGHVVMRFWPPGQIHLFVPITHAEVVVLVVVVAGVVALSVVLALRRRV
jgi:signal peptidase I